MLALSYSILVGILVFAGVYLIIQRSLVRIVIGITILSNAANLIIFSSGKFIFANSPIISDGQKQLNAPYADPLPQALILTAIVIGFGVIAYFVTLCYKAYKNLETDNVDNMRSTES